MPAGGDDLFGPFLDRVPPVAQLAFGRLGGIPIRLQLTLWQREETLPAVSI